MKKFIFVILCLSILTLKVEAQRGCCSHHHGVHGFNSDGRTICNDGTLSPTCTCTPTIKYIYGCTDKSAKNYNPNANKNDGSCNYYIYGCMDKEAKNYNPNAEKSNNNCEYYIHGCTDKTALNYNELAEKNDGSCTYSKPETTKVDNKAEPLPKEETNPENKKETSSGIFTTIGAVITTATIFCLKKKIF